MYNVYFCSERDYTCVKLNTMNNAQNVHKEHRGLWDCVGGALDFSSWSAELEFHRWELHPAYLHYLPRAAEGAAETNTVGKRSSSASAFLRLPCKPVRMCTGKLETNSPVVIWALKVWGIWTELKTPSPRYQLEMFSHFKDAGGGVSHLGESPLSLPLDGFATFLTGVGDPFLRLSAPLPRFQKSIVLSPQIRSRWSQAWPDWTLPIPEFGKSLVLGPQTSTT